MTMGLQSPGQHSDLSPLYLPCNPHGQLSPTSPGERQPLQGRGTGNRWQLAQSHVLKESKTGCVTDGNQVPQLGN